MRRFGSSGLTEPGPERARVRLDANVSDLGLDVSSTDRLPAAPPEVPSPAPRTTLLLLAIVAVFRPRCGRRLRSASGSRRRLPCGRRLRSASGSRRWLRCGRRLRSGSGSRGRHRSRRRERSGSGSRGRHRSWRRERSGSGSRCRHGSWRWGRSGSRDRRARRNRSWRWGGRGRQCRGRGRGRGRGWTPRSLDRSAWGCRDRRRNRGGVSVFGVEQHRGREHTTNEVLHKLATGGVDLVEAVVCVLSVGHCGSLSAGLSICTSRQRDAKSRNVVTCSWGGRGRLKASWTTSMISATE